MLAGLKRTLQIIGAIGVLGFAGPQGADQPSERLLQRGSGQSDDLRIGEEVVKERTDVLNPLRTTEIQQNNRNLRSYLCRLSICSCL